MNRAERRRIQKKQNKKEPIYNISQDHINKIKADAYEKATTTAMVLLLSLPIKVLKEHYGWGYKRLPEFAEFLTDAYQDFCDSGRSLEEEVDYIYKMTGIKIEKNPEY